MHKHLRNTFLAGILAAVPVAVTIFVIWWIDNRTRDISVYLLGRDLPVVGLLIAVIAIYLTGLAVTSLIGRSFLATLDRTLTKVPILRPIYAAWKQVALTPGGTEGMYSKVVLIPDETGQTLLMGFTSNQPVEGDPQTLCVFVPNAPNPITGRLYFVNRACCRIVDLSPDEAFKIILSIGNYIPPQIGAATAAHL